MFGQSATVSVLFNEPKLLKSKSVRARGDRERSVSVLFNEPKLLKSNFAPRLGSGAPAGVSVLFNEPKLLKSTVAAIAVQAKILVSVLFNEPKLLKS